MATPEILDFKRLLAPISDDRPTGVDLRSDSAARVHFDAVLEARKAAKRAEQLVYRDRVAGEEDGAPQLEKPDWRQVIAAATAVLCNQSKDLWITAWLIEGLVREHGFAGLRDGFRLVQGLCGTYWEAIHPRPDEHSGEDVGYTLAQIAGLDSSLKPPIHAIAITAGDAGGYSSTDYIAAVELGQDAGLSAADFAAAVRATSAAFYQVLFDDLGECVDALTAMREVLDAKCGNDDKGFTRAPGFTQLEDLLDDCQHRLKVIAGDALAEAPADGAPAPAAMGALVAQPVGSVTSNAGPVTTRGDAFKVLTEVAKFFERTEPHSPVSYALRQVVRWGQMSLPDLLAELIADESTRADIFRRMGIARPPQGDERA